ncbi:MAG: amidohydrolase family protein [Clostridiaceae bacterium]|nr:amidohydrolase family protein [Clostridiaceae bacterium]
MKITLVLVNGKIHTMDGKDCEAVAVSDDKIVKVGTSEEINRLVDHDTKVIDLEGKSVLPGFIDTHTHLVGYGAALNSVDLSTAKSTEDIIEYCQQFIKKNKTQPGEWLLGRGWNQNQFIGAKEFPTKEDLDKIGDKNPLLLLRTCGHIGVANTIALQDVGVTKDTFIEGGAFDKD